MEGIFDPGEGAALADCVRNSIWILRTQISEKVYQLSADCSLGRIAAVVGALGALWWVV